MRCDTTGKRRVPGLEICERLLPMQGVVEGPMGLQFDGSRRAERIYFYFFHNVLRHYRGSALFGHMCSILRPGDVFVDVGAHLGVFSLLAGTFGARALLFEPEPAHAAFLSRNAAVLGTVFAAALGSSRDRRELCVGDDRNMGGSSLVMSARGWAASGYSHRVEVECHRLDDLVKAGHCGGTLRLVKIDVEGAEEEVVAGMEDLLRGSEPDVWCEVRGDDSDRNPGSFRPVTSHLRDIGYRPLVRDRGAYRPFDEGSDVRRVFDLLFVKGPA